MVKTNYIRFYSMDEGYVDSNNVQDSLETILDGHYKKIFDDEKMTIWTLVEDHSGDDVERGIYNFIGLKG